MTYIKHYRCTLCERTYDNKAAPLTCLTCGERGILEIEYDYEAIKKVINKEYFNQTLEASMWRYLPLLPVNGMNTDRVLKVGWTPLYRVNNLAKHLGINTLYLKDEGVEPSGSLKDRASAIAVLKAIEANQHTIACSSTGNAASSLAANAAKAGLKSVIFVPKRAPIGKLTQLSIYHADVIQVDGDYKATFQLSKKAIEKYQWYNRNAAINPHLVEGKKTVALEVAEQLNFHVTDWVVVSVGDGCTIAGLYKGFYDFYQLGLITKIPKLLGVQSEGCSPFYTAWKENKPLVETDENTIADSIAVGIPRNPVKGMNAVIKSQGAFITVSDQEILEAMKLLGKHEGVFAEPASSASIAGLINALKNTVILPSESVTIIHTGNGLKDPQNAQSVLEKPVLISPDMELLTQHLKKQGVIQ